MSALLNNVLILCALSLAACTVTDSYSDKWKPLVRKTVASDGTVSSVHLHSFDSGRSTMEVSATGEASLVSDEDESELLQDAEMQDAGELALPAEQDCGLTGTSCPGINGWVSSLTDALQLCVANYAVTAGSTCAAWCENQGYQCLRGQNEISGTCAMKSQSGLSDNGCQQAKNDQICQCGKKAYITYQNKNAYNGHGAEDIDSTSSAPTGLSQSQCEQRCTDDPSCECVTHRKTDSKCWKRKACNPSSFARGNIYDVYVKQTEAEKPAKNSLEKPAEKLAEATEAPAVFNAVHRVWSGTITMDANHRFQKVDNGRKGQTLDGSWSVSGNALSLDWDKYAVAVVETSDGGNTFSDGNGFTLTRSGLPTWWLVQFKAFAGWVLGGKGESCDAACAAKGSQCSEQGLYEHNAEVDTKDELEAVTGVGCISYKEGHGNGYGVPNIIANGGLCFATATDRDLITFSCNTIPGGKGKSKQRVCYCEAKSR